MAQAAQAGTPPAAAEQPARDPSKTHFYVWASHPLVLLIASALLIPYVSSHIIPDVTLQWQKSQKALDIKTGLVTDISQSTTNLVVAAQVFELIGPNQKLVDVQRAYTDWTTQSSVIAARLHAYYPNTGIAAAWSTYAAMVTDFYDTIDCGSTPNRLKHLYSVRYYLTKYAGGGAGLSAKDWVNLATCPYNADTKSPYPIPRGSPFEGSWYALRTAVLDQQTDILNQIVSTPVQLS